MGRKFNDETFSTVELAPRRAVTQPDDNGRYEITETGKLNHFFLRAFDQIYHRFCQCLTTIEAPFSKDALARCTDEQIETFFKEIDLVPYWSNVGRAAKESFIYNFYTSVSKIGSADVLSSFIGYALDNAGFKGEPLPVYRGRELAPHIYTLLVDIKDGQLVPTREAMNRLIRFVNDVVPVTEKLDGITYRDESDPIDVMVHPCNLEDDEAYSYVYHEAPLSNDMGQLHYGVDTPTYNGGIYEGRVPLDYVHVYRVDRRTNIASPLSHIYANIDVRGYVKWLRTGSSPSSAWVGDLVYVSRAEYVYPAFNITEWKPDSTPILYRDGRFRAKSVEMQRGGSMANLLDFGLAPFDKKTAVMTKRGIKIDAIRWTHPMGDQLWYLKLQAYTKFYTRSELLAMGMMPLD